MKQRINTIQAVDILLQDDNANWSIEWAKALVEYLEELEEETGEELEFDVVAIRCDFTETTIYEVLDQYEEIREDFKEYKDREEEANKPIEEEDKEKIKEIISEYTTIIEVNDNKIIIQDF